MHTTVGSRGFDRGHVHGAHVMPGSSVRGHGSFHVPVGGESSYRGYRGHGDGAATAVLAGAATGVALGTLASTSGSGVTYVSTSGSGVTSVSLAKMPRSTKIGLLVGGIVALIVGIALAVFGGMLNPGLLVGGIFLAFAGVIMMSIGGAALGATSRSSDSL